ncbi:MAG: acylneuraminate cytidylyltransferase family protein [Pseudomonadota bacterium]|nr:acylneuraminate cytidylyltransferase family protein [Pseudomonadota bacterium]
MISGRKVLAVIPASSDTKGIKSLYTRTVAGKSLIGWTVLVAEQSFHIDKVILSSDDLSIIQEAKNYGCDVPFLRPKSLVSNDTPTIETILHAIDMMPGFDIVVILPPSSPLRTADDIDNCLQLCVTQQAPAALSVTEPAQCLQRCYTITPDFHLLPVIKDPPPKVFVQNGAIAVAHINWLHQQRSFLLDETAAYVMPRERSLDVVTEYDLQLADACLRVAGDVGVVS